MNSIHSLNLPSLNSNQFNLTFGARGRRGRRKNILPYGELATYRTDEKARQLLRLPNVTDFQAMSFVDHKTSKPIPIPPLFDPRRLKNWILRSQGSNNDITNTPEYRHAAVKGAIRAVQGLRIDGHYIICPSNASPIIADQTSSSRAISVHRGLTTELHSLKKSASRSFRNEVAKRMVNLNHLTQRENHEILFENLGPIQKSMMKKLQQAYRSISRIDWLRYQAGKETAFLSLLPGQRVNQVFTWAMSPKRPPDDMARRILDPIITGETGLGPDLLMSRLKLGRFVIPLELGRVMN